MTSGTTAGQWTILARLVRPQGRHGEILADILTDFPDRFSERKCLFLFPPETTNTPAREVCLEKHWLHKGRIVLKFAGVDSINDANALRGLLVAIPAGERATLPEGSVYLEDLIGCQVVDLGEKDLVAKVVGTVTDVDRKAGLLAVNTTEGLEALLPFVGAYLVKMDLAAKRIEMRLPAGLLAINAPMTEEERRELNTST
jgi:16S rRNA processing protein RimM